MNHTHTHSDTVQITTHRNQFHQINSGEIESNDVFVVRVFHRESNAKSNFPLKCIECTLNKHHHETHRNSDRWHLFRALYSFTQCHPSASFVLPDNGISTNSMIRSTIDSRIDYELTTTMTC